MTAQDVAVWARRLKSIPIKPNFVHGLRPDDQRTRSVQRNHLPVDRQQNRPHTRSRHSRTTSPKPLQHSRHQLISVTGVRVNSHPSSRRPKPIITPVKVAAADRSSRGPPRLPPRNRPTPLGRRPTRVPHLSQRGMLRQRMPPRTVPTKRMVDRQQPTTLPNRLHPVGGRLAKVDPPDVTKSVGMPELGSDLLPRNQRDAISPTDRSQLGMMTDSVVVGDGKRVEPGRDSLGGQLGDGQRPVGMQCVGVQIGSYPAQSSPGGQTTRPRLGRHRRVRPRRGHLDIGVGTNGDRHLDTAGRKPMQAEHDVPLPRLKVTRHITGRSGLRSDHIAPTSAAGPAAPSPRALTAQVDHRPRRLVELQLDGDGPATARHVER